MQYGSSFGFGLTSGFHGKHERNSFARSFGKRKKFGSSTRIEDGSSHRTEWRMRALFLLFLFVILLGGGTLSAAPRHPASGKAAREVGSEATTAVLFEFAKPVPDAFWETLKGELDANAAPVWPERSAIWMKRDEFRQGMEYPEIVQVRLLGHCGEPSVTGRFGEGPLGWAKVTDGEIQPVAYVNCDRIAQTLESELRGANGKERRQKFARAVARVVGHELTHIFQQNRKHSASGLQKAYLTAGELTKEGFL